MSYTQLVKQWERDFNKKKKLSLIETKQRQEREEKENANIICEGLINRINDQYKQKELITIKENILLSLRKNNPFTYPQYLIIWDIIHTNYDQILTDLTKNRITQKDIINAIDYVVKFSNELINEYWEERLLS